ncbi:MAG: hypothetical protein ABIJ12_09530 [bacterium]
MSDSITTKSRIIAIFVIFIFIAITGCSSDKTKVADVKTDLDTNYYSHLKPEEQEIANTLNEALQRLKYNDKSGLYELEFSYYTDEHTYDDYIKRGEIQYAQMDSINHLEVYDFTYYDDDSADVNIAYVFNSAAGGFTTLKDMFRLFKSHDRWVKPTVTTLQLQLEYDYKIQKAIEAAEEENK